MDRNEYLKKCQKASSVIAAKGVWWQVNWEPTDLVKYNGDLRVPHAYRIDFKSGVPLHIAILHDLRSNTEYNVELEKVTANE